MNTVIRPIQLKLAIVLASFGLLVDLIGYLLAKEIYGEGWILVFSFKCFVTILWFVAFILILGGRGWPRYLYSGFFIYGVVRLIYLDSTLLLQPIVAFSTALSALAVILWFLPASNSWLKGSGINTTAR